MLCAGLAILLALSGLPAAATVSQAVDASTATTYGATVTRGDDTDTRYQPPRFIPDDVTAPAEVLLQQLWLEENELGAYSPALVPALRELGAALFMDGQYADSIAAYRRAIHLLRVNEGLNTPAQAGMVKQLIEAYVEMGDYVAADDQQRYLFRIRKHQLAADDPEMLEAVEQLALWHRSAYLSQFDRLRFPRIVELFDLYSEAASEVEALHGEQSRLRLPYLEGKLRTAYLLSVYPGETELAPEDKAQQRDNSNTSDVTRLRFNGFSKDNFRRGLAAIREMRSILEQDPQATTTELADMLVMKGDWYQWHQRFAQAVDMYEAAWDVVEDEPDAVNWRLANFQNPRELPAGRVFQPGRIPVRLYYDTDVHVRFAVSRIGLARDIEILAPDRTDNQPAVTRGYKYLRSMRFRPRLEDGEVVATESVERIYNLRY
jgi:tetratricopeptide (TPR) repeat protein